MSATGRALVAGYEWRQRFVSPVALFPSAATFTAQIRRTVADAEPLATLTTGNGGVVRVDDTTLDVIVAGATSAGWTAGSVVFDVVRSDGTAQHLGFRVTVPVVMPVTRL
mgnify:CR=1 FL=1